MTLQELIAEFRILANDEAQPYLWSDPELLRFAVEAQDRLVWGIGGIADVTVAAADVGSPVTRLQDLALVADSPWSAVSPHIIRIRSGRLLSAARDVKFAQESDKEQVMVRDYGWSVGTTFDDEDTGIVTHGFLGMRDGYVRWLRVPSEVDTCRLHLFRYPFPRIADQDDALEIAERHHYELLSWMLFRAYGKQDAEARNDKLAAESRAKFDAYVQAVAAPEAQRQRYRTRTVQYGGL